MKKRIDSPRLSSLLWLALGPALFLALGAGCSFDSSLSQVACNEEGERADGRVCQDGHWVVEADATLDADPSDTGDVTPPPDAELDAPVDAEADATTCPAEQTLCGGQCVDLSSSADHCGACNSPCQAVGEHALATCEQSSCQRTCEQGWVDADGDWIGADDPAVSNGCELECTETNGGTEICDGLDNNCDGQVDEGVKTTYYRDADDDTFGVDGDTRQLCAPEGDYTATRGEDCDDAAFSINPDATESCNGFDDDCDGDIDPTPPCSCTDGATQPCYTGPAGTENVGICLGGQRTCNSGTWGSCEQQTLPETEVCDDADDNDCDGDTNCADSDCDAAACGGGGKICYQGNCCTPPDKNTFCANQAAQCGEVTATDACGQTRTENCGDCGGGANCDLTTYTCQETKCGDGNDNDNDSMIDCADDDCPAGTACDGGAGICQAQSCCTSPDKATFCANQGALCGEITATDACGQTRTENCGGCGGGATCDAGANTCIETSCDDGNDNDGDNLIDCADDDCNRTYYFDGDGDGYGLQGNSRVTCQPSGDYTATVDGDCDDTESNAYPGAPEICDGNDWDCDGTADDADADADAWCSANNSPTAGCGISGGTTCCLNPGGNACK